MHPQHKISFELIKSSFSARFHVWTITEGGNIELGVPIEREGNFVEPLEAELFIESLNLFIATKIFI